MSGSTGGVRREAPAKASRAAAKIDSECFQRILLSMYRELRMRFCDPLISQCVELLSIRPAVGHDFCMFPTAVHHIWYYAENHPSKWLSFYYD